MTRPLSLVKTPTVSEKRFSFSPFWFTFWVVRILILSIGLSAIGGAVLTTLKPSSIPFFSSLKIDPQPVKTPIPATKTLEVTPPPTQSLLPLKQEVLPLKKEILSLAKKNPQLKPYGLFVDLDNGNYVDIDSTKAISAASTIKLPVLVAFFQDVDAGKIRLDENLTMTKDDVADGSGNMQYEKPDKQYTALDVVTRMIVISDNTATNMLIRRLGGKDALNKRFTSWGMTATSIKSPLSDLKGTNLTSAKDLAFLLYKINQAELVSLKSRDRMLAIMQKTETRTLLPQGLEENADIAHKTGDIGIILGDAAIINMPNGKRFIAVVFATRPYNDVAGRILIQQISKTIYQGFKNSPTTK